MSIWNRFTEHGGFPHSAAKNYKDAQLQETLNLLDFVLYRLRVCGQHETVLTVFV